MTGAPLLEVADLTVEAGGRRIVDGISFAVRHGRTLALIGESGSGKSMTALSVMGLLPDGVRTGAGTAIRLDGTAVPYDDPRALRAVRRHRLAIVFQDPMACLNPFMRIGAQIAEALRDPAVWQVRSARIASLLREVELPESAADKRPHELSGGQQQRAMLAMALAGEPDLLIADEPTSALDASIQAEIVALLGSIQRRRRMAMLLITHDLGVAAALAHDIAVMRRGAIVETGPAETVLSAPRHAYTQRLVHARRTLLAAGAPARGPGTEIAVEAEALSVDYPARRLFGAPFRAVHDASFRLARGAALGIVGESGSGKSTLAAAVAGLRPPAAGTIRLLGRAITPDHPRLPRSLRRRCQLVFQNPYGALNPRLAIGRSLAEPLALAGVAPEERAARIRSALQDVGLEPAHAGRYPHELSGGQRQRACIARALLCEPEVLVCDEVVSALDMTVQVQVLELLRRLRATHGFSLLFIGHDLDVVRWISDEILVMQAGRIVDRCRADAIEDKARSAATRRLVRARLRRAA